jgi:nitrogen fixation protein NifZ
MKHEQEEYRYQVGDMVFARTVISNDGYVPDYALGESIAAPGVRGVIVQVGHVEVQPEVSVYLVQFETAPGELGPPVGCLANELAPPERSDEHQGVAPSETV